jgi:hypothetical protein
LKGIEGTVVNDVLLHMTKYPVGSHQHPPGHSTATFAGGITNHNENITAGVANSSDSNSTVSLDGMASCCNLQRERDSRRTDSEYSVFCENMVGLFNIGI